MVQRSAVGNKTGCSSHKNSSASQTTPISADSEPGSMTLLAIAAVGWTTQRECLGQVGRALALGSGDHHKAVVRASWQEILGTK